MRNKDLKKRKMAKHRFSDLMVLRISWFLIHSHSSSCSDYFCSLCFCLETFYSARIQWRSPEEYHYDPQTEKVDVYSFGNVLYSVLTGKYPFQDKEEKEARKLIKKGNRPIISSSVRNSTDPFDQAMITAIEMCWIQDPSERASARQVQQFFLSELRRLGVRENR